MALLAVAADRAISSLPTCGSNCCHTGSVASIQALRSSARLHVDIDAGRFQSRQRALGFRLGARAVSRATSMAVSWMILRRSGGRAFHHLAFTIHG